MFAEIATEMYLVDLFCVFLCSFFGDVLSVNHFALRLRTR